MDTNVLEKLHHEHHEHETSEKVLFGFWVYILSDCILFSCLFATYIVLHGSTYGGHTSNDLFSNKLPYVLTETFLLLISSFTYGIAKYMLLNNKKNKLIFWLFITFLLGLSFVCMEIREFHELIIDGIGPDKSAFLSAFFTLVGTHGLHVTCGLIWMILLMLQVNKHGITPVTSRKIYCLSLFWHFLDIVWIFVFTFVYLIGTL